MSETELVINNVDWNGLSWHNVDVERLFLGAESSVSWRLFFWAIDMVGFNLGAEEREKLVAEYEAQANAAAVVVKHSNGAKAEGSHADADDAAKSAKKGK